MDFEMLRDYHPDYTTGSITANGVHLCHTIELPDRENKRNLSCIPEGRYEITIRNSARFKEHIHVLNVVNRSWILLHPANDARKELRGCIGPVLNLIYGGRGSWSRNALNILIVNMKLNPGNHYLNIENAKYAAAPVLM